MKILYAIQGTGNGHISRALELVPSLKQLGEVDLLLSGTQSDIQLPWPVKYRFHGISFVFGKNGGIAILDSLRQFRPFRFVRDTLTLPLAEYDLVISDFEPVSAWAALLKNKKCLGLSHQASFFSASVPLPRKRDLLANFILKYYAYTPDRIGFHFKSYDDFIFPPIIRSKIRHATPVDKGHITLYLPAYADERLVEHLSGIANRAFEIFSKKAKSIVQHGHITIRPIQNDAFTESLISCHGLITGGGFETPAEAMYLGKKIMLIPMQNQYEQHANALAAKQLGCTLVREVNDRFSYRVRRWLEFDHAVQLQQPDPIPEILAEVLKYTNSETAVFGKISFQEKGA